MRVETGTVPHVIIIFELFEVGEGESHQRIVEDLILIILDCKDVAQLFE